MYNRKRPTVDWRAPDYEETYRYRAEITGALRRNRSHFPEVREFYSGSALGWTEFIQDWMSTSDPRRAGSGPVTIPFVLFPRQVEYIHWVYERWRAQERGLAEKSREVGLSWLSMAAAVIVWLFFPEANVGVGSRKEELVDNGDADQKSLFWKARRLISLLPDIWIPAGYPDRNSKWGVIWNPANRAAITGEIGDNIGMGDRTSLYFVDEADALQHPMQAEAGLAATTECRIDVSTTNQVGTVFYNNRRMLPERQVFIFDWTQDPRKRQHPELPPSQEPWYIKKRAEVPDVFAAQYERNPAAAVSNTFISRELIQVPQERSSYDIIQADSAAWRIGIDASGMGADEAVVWSRKGRINRLPEVYEKLDGMQLASKVLTLAAVLLKTGPIELVCIERDGPGGSCADFLKYSFLSSVLAAIHTGAKLADGIHYNLRAWLHYQARDYLTENEVVLPKDEVFLAQATAVRSLPPRGGLRLMESKEDYRRRLSGASTLVAKQAGKSPDRWDAFMLTFYLPRGKPVESTAGAASFSSAGFTPWRPLDPVMGY